MPQKSPLFHIGYHKTGTTWMQAHFFRERCGFRQILSPGDDVCALIIDPLRPDFDPAPARARIAAWRAEPDAPCGVVSSELLLGHPFYGGREGYEFAERVHAIAPDARILLVIREQIAAMVSTYIQYLSRGGSLGLDRFLAKPGGYGYYFFDPAHFEYDRRVAFYRGLFGAGRVMVATHEAFVADNAAALRRISRFAGADPALVRPEDLPPPAAESAREWLVPALRRINHLRSGAAGREAVADLGALSDALYAGVVRIGTIRPLARRLRGHRPLRRRLAARFAGRFAESNRRLQDMLGGETDLAALGYDLG